MKKLFDMGIDTGEVLYICNVIVCVSNTHISTKLVRERAPSIKIAISSFSCS